MVDRTFGGRACAGAARIHTVGGVVTPGQSPACGRASSRQPAGNRGHGGRKQRTSAYPPPGKDAEDQGRYLQFYPLMGSCRSGAHVSQERRDPRPAGARTLQRPAGLGGRRNESKRTGKARNTELQARRHFAPDRNKMAGIDDRDGQSVAPAWRVTWENFKTGIA